MAAVRILPVGHGDCDRVASLLASSWGSTIVVSRGVRHDASRLPAFLAERDGKVVGLLTYAVDGDAMEVVTVDALERRVGVGSELLAAFDAYGSSPPTTTSTPSASISGAGCASQTCTATRWTLPALDPDRRRVWDRGARRAGARVPNLIVLHGGSSAGANHFAEQPS